MTYASLIAEFPLRILNTPEDYKSAQEFWSRYISEAVKSPRVSESVIQYAEVLSLLMEKYEQEQLNKENDE